MIVSETAGFIIATPTKCGSTSLKSMARRHEKHFDDEAFTVLHTGDKHRFYQHRMIPGEDRIDYDRYIIVRHPARRYLSIYDYMRSYTNYSAWSANIAQGDEWPEFCGGKPNGNKQRRQGPPLTFSEYMWYLVEQRDVVNDPSNPENHWKRGNTEDDPSAFRAPWVWTDSLYDSMVYLAGDDCDIEDIGIIKLESMDGDLDDIKIAYGDAMSHVNLKPVWSNRSKSMSHSDVWHEAMEESCDHSPPCGSCLRCRLGIDRECETLGYRAPAR
jgi:hypothetical protein